jgi:hypothetical protein
MFFRSIGQSLGAAALGAIANTVIFAQGGDETVPSTMQSAAGAVFTGAAVVALLLLVAAIAMPRLAAVREAAVDPA